MGTLMIFTGMLILSAEGFTEIDLNVKNNRIIGNDDIKSYAGCLFTTHIDTTFFIDSDLILHQLKNITREEMLMIINNKELILDIGDIDTALRFLKV